MLDIEKTEKKIVVLGAGITGLTVAWELSKTFKNQVVLLEKESIIGGLATTFKEGVLSLDIGSHRLHDDGSEVFRIIKELCGNGLLQRDRKGLIYIKDKYINYPPTVSDILTAFGIVDCIRFCVDLFIARIISILRRDKPSDFESFTKSEIGSSLYERFYKPYAMKLWAMNPMKISKEPAQNRVRKFTFTSMFRGLKKKFKKKQPVYYYYPSKGIGYLSDRIKEEFISNGGKLISASAIQKFEIVNNKIATVSYRKKDEALANLETSILISSIPMNVLHSSIKLESDNGTLPIFGLDWRCLRILYLITPDKIPCDNETFYFPETDIIFGRVSEVNKYSPELNKLSDKSVLTLEIPCSDGDELWNMDDLELAKICVEELQKVNILKRDGTGKFECFSKKIKNLYPLYVLGWRKEYDRIYKRLDSVENLFMIGRTALFLHCNIDHCMDMGLKLARFIVENKGNKSGWDNIVKDFFDFRVRE